MTQYLKSLAISIVCVCGGVCGRGGGMERVC